MNEPYKPSINGPFEPLDIDDAFAEYARLVGIGHLPEHSPQFIETKRGFIAGMMRLYLHISIEVTKLDDDKAGEELQAVDTMLGKWWRDTCDQASMGQ